MIKMKKFNILALLVALMAVPFLTLAQNEGLPSINKREIDRGIKQSTFIPKGQWLMGGSFSYNQYTADDFKFIVMENISGDSYSFMVSPYFGYFVKDNLCIGGRFSYRRSLLRLDKLNLKIDDDLDFNINDYYSLQHVYTGALIMRNYMSLGNSKRFGLFNEIRLGFGGGQGKVLSGSNDDLTGTFQNIFEMELGLTPGLLAFITNEVAVEASVNVLGFNYKRYSQTRDQVYKGYFEKSSVNFKVNIFSINIGISFHIPYLNPLKKRTVSMSN